MEVETYEVLDSAEVQSPEFAEEASALIESLGLEGQRSLVVKRENGTETRIPYREMTGDELFAYRTLCPQTSDVHKFKSEAMPLRVMQVLAHAKSLDCFKSFEVWHPRDASIKDPVLVGVMQDAEQSWVQRRYILARWGEVLDALPTLMEKAGALFLQNAEAALSEVEAEVQTARAQINAARDNAAARVGLGRKHNQEPQFYWN